jgi:hypothetical protein
MWPGLAFGALSACAQPRAPAQPAASAAPVSHPERAPADGSAPWTYEVTAEPGGVGLAVRATFAPGTDPELTVGEGAEPFVEGVEVLEAAGGSAWKAVPSQKGSWFAPSCTGGCTVRYRVVLGDAARAHDDVRLARATPQLRSRAHEGPPAKEQAIAAPPSTWLLRPARDDAGTRFRFHVTPAPGEAFASGIFPVANAKDTYEGLSGERFDLPYAAFGALRVHDLDGGWVELAILPGAVDHEDDVVAWAEACARAVRSFYGAPPVKRLLVLMRPTRGDGVGFGTTMGTAGAAIAVDVGGESTKASLADDWVLTHEMVHTALPDLLGPHHWLEEGLATYVEPIARARAGLVKPEDVWSEWVSNMPKGEPEPGDRGLDRTPTWGRTYWGGALFCLVADLAIRERTRDAKSLRDALRAIDAASGGIAASWPMDRVIAVGDAATGVPVLRELYAKMSNDPAPVDLDATWKRLGIAATGKGLALDAKAPLAAIREHWLAP